MKTKKHLIAIMVIIAIIQPISFVAQNLIRKEATVAKPAETWSPVKITESGDNVKNGVVFYSFNEVCNSQKVKFLKLINKNTFAVKVSYQLSEKSSVVNIMIPPSLSVEGYCGASDSNTAKLAITVPPVKSNEEKQKNLEFMRTHITVTQIN